MVIWTSPAAGAMLKATQARVSFNSQPAASKEGVQKSITQMGRGGGWVDRASLQKEVTGNEMLLAGLVL